MSDECKTKFRIGVEFNFSFKVIVNKGSENIEKKINMWYTKQNSAFAEKSSLKTDLKEVFSNIVYEVLKMAISYKKLWKLLIDRDMKKKDLCAASGISHASMAKLGKNENVTTDVLVKICTALKCDIGDIMEVVDDVR